MADFSQLAKGLLTLEINTVQKDGMSAQKMPAAPSALIEVAQTYWSFLCAKAQDFQLIGETLDSWAFKISRSFDWGREPFPQPAGMGDRPVKRPETEPYPPGHNADFLREPPDFASFLVFDHLREIAAWISEMQARTAELARDPQGAFAKKLTAKKLGLEESELTDAAKTAKKFRTEERAVLHRIRRNSDQFKHMLDRIDPSAPPAGRSAYGERALVIGRDFDERRFASADLVLIRKAWDIGTEIVLMQTVIQIDGDVVNRFQSGVDSGSRAQLHAIHASAVDLSFRYWRWLVDALGRLAGQAVSTLLK